MSLFLRYADLRLLDYSTKTFSAQILRFLQVYIVKMLLEN